MTHCSKLYELLWPVAPAREATSAQAASRHPPPWARTLQVHFLLALNRHTHPARGPLSPGPLWVHPNSLSSLVISLHRPGGCWWRFLSLLVLGCSLSWRFLVSWHAFFSFLQRRNNCWSGSGSAAPSKFNFSVAEDHGSLKKDVQQFSSQPLW